MIIGIIGGGQLGMMMAIEAKKLNHTVYSLDPSSDCPLSHYSDKHITAAYDDASAIKELCRISDVVTYEFENVDYNLVKEFEDKIPQKSKALYVTQNRLKEKSFAASLGIDIPKNHKLIDNPLFYPCIIKTTSGGYDGKGQYLCNNSTEFDQYRINVDIEHIVEEKIAFEFEISVVLTRDVFNNIEIQPITKNTHRNGILFTSSTNVELSEELKDKAVTYSKKIIQDLDYVGTMAIEYFVTEDRLIFNEYAPRPHNSGHHSIDSTDNSQFKNHILAVTGYQVLPVSLIKQAVMINVLGQDNIFIKRSRDITEVKKHWYKKTENKINRKMGHLTVVTNNLDRLNNIVNSIIKE